MHRCCFFLFLVNVLVSCKEDPKPYPLIRDFTPTLGRPSDLFTTGTAVTITGLNFNSGTTVKFNGHPADLIDVNSERLTAITPADATTGKISITSNNQTTFSALDFTVTPPPFIISITPTTASVGSTVTLHGFFVPQTWSNSVEFKSATGFNDLKGTVTAATTTEVVVIVPQGALTGALCISAPGKVSCWVDLTVN